MAMSETRSRRAVARASAGLLLAVLLGSAFESSPALAAERASFRDETVEVLLSLAAEPAGFALRAWLNDGEQRAIPIGAPVEYHFLADRKAHLTVLHVDAHGVATLLYPNDLDSGNLLRANVERTFPAPDDGFVVHAQPPVGREIVLALATVVPLRPEDLGVSFAAGPVAVVEAERAPALARRLRERWLALDPSARAVARFEQIVLGRSAAAEYDSVDIVSYFSTRARSIRRPRLDLHVQFESGSDALDGRARANLDEVAKALLDARMRSMRFSVGGHTDDVGDEAYNDDLSRRRAQSVVRYLSGTHPIDPGRFEIEHYGETRPLEPGTTPEARRLNRRVEFELVR